MLTIDDLQRLDALAAQRVDELWTMVTQQFLEPELQRQELAEYDSLPPDAHARILLEVGEDNYRAWADEMERRRVKYASSTGVG